MTIYPLKENQLLFVLYIYLYILLTPVRAFESKDYFLIDILVNSCYNNSQSCDSALLQIHNYQKNAATRKKLSCQTRLLGLEANLIMAMNSNIKKKEGESIIQAVKKHC